MASKNSKDVRKITITSNTRKDQVKVEFTPKFDTGVRDRLEVQKFLNTLVAGVHVGLQSLFIDLPVLRPVTELEQESMVYIFQDEQADNNLYKTRKQLYDGIAEVFNNILKELFPDIEYISATVQHQQELVCNMDPDEYAEYKKTIEQIAKTVRNEGATLIQFNKEV